MDIFLFDLIIELPKNTGINKYTIKLVERKQPPYGLIYAHNPVELETLNIYIKIHLKTRFIRLFKSLISTAILFGKKLDSSLRLWANY